MVRGMCIVRVSVPKVDRVPIYSDSHQAQSWGLSLLGPDLHAWGRGDLAPNKLHCFSAYSDARMNMLDEHPRS
jgi:hypothetical protein